MGGLASIFICIYFVLRACYSPAQAVPPEICFANFRWEDCGMPPKAVIYYWKPGSRCEVGIWRGCTPNVNMFPDEYACVNTCIFRQRLQEDDIMTTTFASTTGFGNSTGGNVTDSGLVGNGTAAEGGDTNVPGNTEISGGNATAGEGNNDATTGAQNNEGGGENPEAAPDGARK